MKVTKKFPQGMPWETEEERKGGTRGCRRPNGRMASAIQVRSADLERLQKLLEVAKAEDLWRESFGKCAFTVNIPDFDTDPPVRDRYIHMVQVHGGVQLSLGVAGMPGVTQLDNSHLLSSSNRTKMETGSPVRARRFVRSCYR